MRRNRKECMILTKQLTEITFADAVRECKQYYDSLSLSKKHDISAANLTMGARVVESRIAFDGRVDDASIYSIRGNGGDYYVYVWAHLLTGQIFYVGSGKEDRWISRNRGNMEMFCKHLDDGDCCVFKVLDDVDEETARFYERYISLSLSKDGAELVNGDNIYGKSAGCRGDAWLKGNSDRISSQMTKDVENYIIEHVPHDLFTGRNVLAVVLFREEYGKAYFSEKYRRGA